MKSTLSLTAGRPTKSDFDVGFERMKNIQRLICVIGMIASAGLGVVSLPSRFMATPAEAKAYEIMQEGLKQEITLGPEQDEVALLSHYAHWNSQEWVMKSKIMILASACFFVLFLLLLIIDVKKGKPTTD